VEFGTISTPLVPLRVQTQLDVEEVRLAGVVDEE
jgi:hypothetical protein